MPGACTLKNRLKRPSQRVGAHSSLRSAAARYSRSGAGYRAPGGPRTATARFEDCMPKHHELIALADRLEAQAPLEALGCAIVAAPRQCDRGSADASIETIS